MSGRIQDYALIVKSHGRSLKGCTEICSLDTSCVTFFYNSKTGQCQTHSILLRPNSADQRDGNWRYYQIYTENCAPQDGLVLYRKENLCYFLSNDKKSWNDANQECIKRGWLFLQIKTKEFQRILTKALAYRFEHSAYIGCYKDKPVRALSKNTGSFSYMSINICRNKCRLKGYKYAGLQRKSFCFCGNHDYDKYGKSTNCVNNCAGNRNEICGGEWANSVYNVGDFYYIGLRNNNGIKKWSDGSLATGFSDWAPNKTLILTNSCVYVDPLQGYKWNERLCTDKLNFLCEKMLKRP